MIIVDASVFAKLFLDEGDRPQVEALIEHVVEKDIGLIAPSLILYEALSIGLRHDVPFDAVMALLDEVRVAGLAMREPTSAELLTAEKIATSGTRGAGYPDLADSIYHAMAIECGGAFITADRRHFAKTRQFGSIVLLADWKPS